MIVIIIVIILSNSAQLNKIPNNNLINIMITISKDFPIPVILCADDIALLADSAQQMQAMLFVCEKWAREYRMMSVFQLFSNGRTGIFSMVISWKFAQGPGAQFAFFLLGHHFCLRLTLRTFSFCMGGGGGGGVWWSRAPDL
jgi:hypothetical protein